MAGTLCILDSQAGRSLGGRGDSQLRVCIMQDEVGLLFQETRGGGRCNRIVYYFLESFTCSAYLYLITDSGCEACLISLEI